MPNTLVINEENLYSTYIGYWKLEILIKYAICSTEWHKIHQKNAICEQLTDQNTHLIKNVLSPIKTDDLQLREESNS